MGEKRRKLKKDESNVQQKLSRDSLEWRGGGHSTMTSSEKKRKSCFTERA
jgi:hypothetical protein